MRTRFHLAPCAIVLILSRAALAAEDTTEQSGVTSPLTEPHLILLHQPPRRVFEASPDKARANVLRIYQIQARSDYAQFFSDLQFTESQIDALTRLLAQQSALPSAWESSGVNFTPQEADHQLAREVQSQIEQFLGPANLQKLAEYQDTLGERSQLKRLVRLLIAVGHPLTSEQSAQLVSIMRAERGDQLERWPNSDEFDRRIKPRFAAVLSAEQREFAELYFAGRAERRHNATDASAPD